MIATATTKATASRKKRRWLRFSLRTLLLVMAAISVWLAVTVNSARRQRAAVESVLDLGGWVRYDYELIQGTFDANAKSSVPTWLLNQLGFDFFHDVVVVNLVYNDDGPQRLDNDQVTDAALKHLIEFPQLRELMLHDTQASDEGMKYVGRLQQLEKIYMWDATEVGDYGVQQLQDLKRLKYIHISNGRLTDESLRVFSTMPELEGLSLQGNRFSDRGLAYLAPLAKLTSLWVGLGDVEITDTGLQHLHGLNNLATLGIQEAGVTLGGIEEIQQQIPNLRVIHGMLDGRKKRPRRVNPQQPTLAFISDLHEPPDDSSKPLAGNYWLPTGVEVNDAERLEPLRRVPGWKTSGYAEGTRFLHFFFSDLNFKHGPLGRIDVLDTGGQPIDESLQNVSRLSTRSAYGQNPGWVFFQLHVRSRLELPDVATVQLRYTSGEWATAGTVAVDADAGERLADGVTLLGVGGQPDETCFVTLMIDEAAVKQSQYRVIAKPKEGVQIMGEGQFRYTRSDSHAMTFSFRGQLSDVAEFQLQLREIFEAKYQDVSLRPGYITAE